MNRQVHRSFFDLTPEMAALPLRDPGGGRVFSYGLDQSPAVRAFLARGGRELMLATFYVYRQMLGPYVNVLDGIEAPEAKDLTAFAPRERELSDELYAPGQVSRLMPCLRNAGVARVLSLDPLSDPALVPLGEYAPGRPGLTIHLYAVDAPWPRELVACRVIDERDPERPILRPYERDFL